MKSPNNGANASGVDGIIPDVDHLVYRSVLARCHVLTDAHGRYTALLCRDSGRLQRLPRGVKI